MRQTAFKANGAKSQATRSALRRSQVSRRAAFSTACSAQRGADQHVAAEVTRRQLLGVSAGAALLAPLVAGTSSASAESAFIPVEQLGAFQRNAQIAAFKARVDATVQQFITAADAPACMRLVLHDAGTYDAVTKQGGFDGSIALNEEELSRPENVDLKPTVEKLAKAKAAIDAAGEADGSGPISWADLLVLGTKSAVQQSWKEIKVKRAQLKSGGETIAGPAFASAWPVRLGRVDRAEAGPAGKVPAAGAPVAEIKAYLLSLGAAPGQYSNAPFSAKPPFWEKPGFVIWTASAADPEAEEQRFVAEDKKAYEGIKVGYDRSRKTVTRTDYEVDFITFFTDLTNLGATFKKDAYLKPEEVPALKLK